MDSVMRGAYKSLLEIPAGSRTVQLRDAIYIGVLSAKEAYRLLKAAEAADDLSRRDHEVCASCSWIDAVGTEYCPECGIRMFHKDVE